MTTGSRGRSRISMKVRHEHFLIRWLLCSLCLDTFLLSHIPILNLSPFALRNVGNSELPVFFSFFDLHTNIYPPTHLLTHALIYTHISKYVHTYAIKHVHYRARIPHTHLIVQTVLSFFHSNENQNNQNYKSNYWIKQTRITSLSNTGREKSWQVHNFLRDEIQRHVLHFQLLFHDFI